MNIFVTGALIISLSVLIADPGNGEKSECAENECWCIPEDGIQGSSFCYNVEECKESPDYVCDNSASGPIEPKHANIGQDCWWHCWGKQGDCAWCGTEGMCCTMKAGWTDTSNGCDGTFGGYKRHECSARPGSSISAPMPAPVAAIPAHAEPQNDCQDDEAGLLALAKKAMFSWNTCEKIKNNCSQKGCGNSSCDGIRQLCKKSCGLC